mmetsp:Transcript_55937/g.93175  ORF Transcript_55937/g.93175 Transcript_55937/m.93175 type:complete len:285 (-) Transcript_55937:1383-2237(-)
MRVGVVHKCLASATLESRHILHQEIVRIVPRRQHLGHRALHILLRKLQLFRANHGRLTQINAQRIRAIRVKDFLGRRIILLALRHLGAILRQHHSIHNQVSPRWRIKQRRRQNEQRIKPSARLIQAFRDEIGGEAFEELVLATLPRKRVMALSVRHRARLEPAIEHFVHAAQRLASLLRFDDNIIDVFAMQIVNLATTAPLQLLHAANHFPLRLLLILVGADPNRNRCAPIAITRHGPITRVHQPIVKAFLLHKRWHPICFLIIRHQLVLDVGHINKPRRNRFI